MVSKETRAKLSTIPGTSDWIASKKAKIEKKAGFKSVLGKAGNAISDAVFAKQLIRGIKGHGDSKLTRFKNITLGAGKASIAPALAIGAGTAIAKKIEAPEYGATRTVAIAGSTGVPGDISFDLGVKALSHYKENRGNFSKGIAGVKEMLKSPEWKAKLNEFKTEQKGIAIPASIAMASIPAIITYRADRKRHLEELKRQKFDAGK